MFLLGSLWMISWGRRSMSFTWGEDILSNKYQLSSSNSGYSLYVYMFSFYSGADTSQLYSCPCSSRWSSTLQISGSTKGISSSRWGASSLSRSESHCHSTSFKISTLLHSSLFLISSSYFSWSSNCLTRANSIRLLVSVSLCVSVIWSAISLIDLCISWIYFQIVFICTSWIWVAFSCISSYF